MSNPRKVGELARIYYKIADYDTTQLDATILADGTWKDLCAISVSTNDANSAYEVNDRCIGSVVGVAPGRRTFSLDLSINQFRWAAADIRAWNTAVNGGSIIALMALTEEKPAADGWGTVGNYVVTSTGTEEPEAGLIVVSYTFQPAADSAYSDPLVDYIYGANIS